jgi:hypothetical protein
MGPSHHGSCDEDTRAASTIQAAVRQHKAHHRVHKIKGDAASISPSAMPDENQNIKNKTTGGAASISPSAMSGKLKNIQNKTTRVQFAESESRLKIEYGHSDESRSRAAVTIQSAVQQNILSRNEKYRNANALQCQFTCEACGSTFLSAKLETTVEFCLTCRQQSLQAILSPQKNIIILEDTDSNPKRSREIRRNKRRERAALLGILSPEVKAKHMKQKREDQQKEKIARYYPLYCFRRSSSLSVF